MSLTATQASGIAPARETKLAGNREETPMPTRKTGIREHASIIFSIIALLAGLGTFLMNYEHRQTKVETTLGERNALREEFKKFAEDFTRAQAEINRQFIRDFFSEWKARVESGESRSRASGYWVRPQSFTDSFTGSHLPDYRIPDTR